MQRYFLFFILLIFLGTGFDASAQKRIKRVKKQTGQNDVIKDGDQHWGVRQGKRKGIKVSKKGRKYTNSKEASKSRKTNKTRFEKPKKRKTKKRLRTKEAEKKMKKFNNDMKAAAKEVKKEDKNRRKRAKRVKKQNQKIPTTQKIK